MKLAPGFNNNSLFGNNISNATEKYVYINAEKPKT